MRIFFFSVLYFISPYLFGQEKTGILGIGDTCPDFNLKMVNYVSANINLSEFRGKAVLLDFWGTWCSPCVASIPKIDSLEKELGNKVAILGVTDEHASKVNTFFDKIALSGKPRIPSVVEDVQLNRAFPHSTVPMYVWIDTAGIVKAITFQEDVTLANLKKLVDGRPLDLAIRDDAATFNHNADVMYESIRGIMKDSNVLSYHLFTKVIPSNHGGVRVKGPGIYASNLSILGLFEIAYGEGIQFFGGWSYVKLITKDSSAFVDVSGVGRWSHQYRESWRLVDGHEYNYLLKLPIEEDAKKFQIMREDLKTYFPKVSAKIVKERRKCYVIRRSPGLEIVSKKQGESVVEQTPYFINIRNSSFSNLVLIIKLAYQNSDIQIVDETNYIGMVDLEYYGSLADPIALNTGLKKCGLQFKEKYRDVDILVIGDRSPDKASR